MDLISAIEKLVLNPTSDISEAINEFPEELKALYLKSDSAQVRKMLSSNDKTFKNMSHCLPFADMSHGLTIGQ